MSQFTHYTVDSLRGLAASYLNFYRRSKRDLNGREPIPSYCHKYHAKYRAYKHAAEIVQRQEIDIPAEFGL